MTVKKLTDADRKEILDLYRHTGETTSTLADRYGVSNSTISRYLKVTLPEEEYEILISAKRAARTSSGDVTPPQLSQPEPQEAASQPEPPEQTVPVPAETTPTPTIRRRRATITQPQTEIPQEIPLPTPEVGLSNTQDTPEILFSQPSVDDPSPVSAVTPEILFSQPSVDAASRSDEDKRAEANTIAEMFGEDLLDESEDEDEDEDEFDDDDDLDEEQPILRRRLPVETFVRVLPLSEAILPRTCYLVIDKAAELITRPLRDFGDLGQIPTQEFQQRTLPVFDNHRVARRFSSKRDRVIKVPDSRMFQKVRTQLQAKGITRLLFDGRVYSLSSV